MSVQGNRICDICKTVVKNLPEVAPREPDTASTQAYEEGEGGRTNPQLFAAEQVPGGADVVFDCIRVSPEALKAFIIIQQRPPFDRQDIPNDSYACFWFPERI